MRYIKKYQLFLEADSLDEVSIENDKVNQESLKMIQSDILFFKSKKQSVIDIFKDINKSDDLINKEMQLKVYNNEKDVKKRNKYLVEYEGIYRLKRSADKLSLSTQDSVSKKSELQKQLDSLTQDFNKISDNDQKVKIQQQIEKTRNYLKDISQKIIDDKKELGLFDKNYQTKIKNFESQMKIEEQKIKNMT
jgi:hypothetical protein